MEGAPLVPALPEAEGVLAELLSLDGLDEGEPEEERCDELLLEDVDED